MEIQKQLEESERTCCFDFMLWSAGGASWKTRRVPRRWQAPLSIICTFLAERDAMVKLANVSEVRRFITVIGQRKHDLGL